MPLLRIGHNGASEPFGIICTFCFAYQVESAFRKLRIGAGQVVVYVYPSFNGNSCASQIQPAQNSKIWPAPSSTIGRYNRARIERAMA